MSAAFRCGVMILSGLLLAFAVSGRGEEGIPAPAEGKLPAIIPLDGFNLQVIDQPLPDHIVTTLVRPCHDWFAATITGLATDRQTTIGLCL